MTPKQEKDYLQEIYQVANVGPYTPDWNVLFHFQVPQWYQDAKFGIFIHWGLYSLAAHANEWYSRNMYIKGREEWEYHRKTFGEHTKFGYKDFIPLFQAEKFDPKEWAELFKASGAQYVFPVAEHHDGYQMYRSKISKYNTWDMGPHRDILGELKDAVEEKGMVFCTSAHRAEHWWFMGHGKEFDSDVKEPLKRGDFYWPAMPEPHEADLQSQPYPSEEFLEDWLLRTCEIIDKYQPSLLYFDWWIQHEAFKEVFQVMTAYYYNRAAQWKKQVAVCYKHDAMMFGSGILEVERGALAEAKPYCWQTDTAIAKNSWCYTDTLEYKTSRQIIQTLIECICKNGNLLLNVGPRGDGSIPEKDAEILMEIGEWMKKNAPAVYGSKPWRIDSEGPTKIQEGQFTDNEELPYTKEDIRFVVNGDSIYAFIMHFPENGEVKIRSLAKSKDQNSSAFHGLIKDVQVLGYESADVVWKRDEEGMYLMVKGVNTDLPVAVRFRMR